VNQSGPAEPIAVALAQDPVPRATVEIQHASLIDLDRDNRRYEWREQTTAPLSERNI
jgi:hypothetical protein